MVYLAEHPALALLETLVNLDLEKDELPESYRLLKVFAPDDTLVDGFDEKAIGGIKELATLTPVTQSFGDRFLEKNETALLEVPSVILPESKNYLLNPNSPDASTITIQDIIEHPFDERLF